MGKGMKSSILSCIGLMDLHLFGFCYEPRHDVRVLGDPERKITVVLVRNITPYFRK